MKTEKGKEIQKEHSVNCPGHSLNNCRCWDSPACTDYEHCWDILAEVIRTTTSLDKLDFNNGVFNYGDEVTALQNDKVVDALANNRTIKILALCYASVGDEGAKAVAAILKENSTIEEVILNKNKISGEGAKAIADSLKHNETLQRIDLGSNSIGAEGAKAIADALKHNNALRHIDLVSNSIGAEGANAIADAIKHNKKLQHIGLSSNELSDEGAKAIADALKHNKTVRSIDLSRNQIGNEGAKAIADALKENTSLQELSIQYNNIGEEGGKHILNALQQIERSAVENIYLWENQISMETSAKIKREVTRIKRRFKIVGANNGQAVAIETTEDGRIQGDENASSSNEEERLTTIHVTNASKGDGIAESDKESNEARRNTMWIMAMETKIRKLQSTISRQQAELANKDGDIAKKEEEIAKKDKEMAKNDKEMAIVMVARALTLQKMAELHSAIKQLHDELALKQEEIERFNGLDVGSEGLENYTKCCVCLEQYEEGPTSIDNQRRLPIKSATCAHSLCEECLDDYHASLMNGRSTLRYVRCPQCNDKTKKAFDIQNKVVDFFLREYIHCRKRKRLA